MASWQGRSGALLTEINVTPLVDVVLVLLVILMVTATALANKAITVEVPKARSGETDASRMPLVVAVDERGTLFLEAVPADDAAVLAKARALGDGGSAVIAADGRARHEAVVHALDLLRGSGIAKVAIVVRRP